MTSSSSFVYFSLATNASTSTSSNIMTETSNVDVEDDDMEEEEKKTRLKEMNYDAEEEDVNVDVDSNSCFCGCCCYPSTSSTSNIPPTNAILPPPQSTKRMMMQYTMFTLVCIKPSLSCSKQCLTTLSSTSTSTFSSANQQQISSIKTTTTEAMSKFCSITPNPISTATTTINTAQIPDTSETNDVFVYSNSNDKVVMVNRRMKRKNKKINQLIEYSDYGVRYDHHHHQRHSKYRLSENDDDDEGGGGRGGYSDSGDSNEYGDDNNPVSMNHQINIYTNDNVEESSSSSSSPSMSSAFNIGGYDCNNNHIDVASSGTDNDTVSTSVTKVNKQTTTTRYIGGKQRRATRVVNMLGKDGGASIMATKSTTSLVPPSPEEDPEFAQYYGGQFLLDNDTNDSKDHSGVDVVGVDCLPSPPPPPPPSSMTMTILEQQQQQQHVKTLKSTAKEDDDIMMMKKKKKKMVVMDHLEHDKILLNQLANECGFAHCEMENVFFENKYMIKFNVHFNMKDTFNHHHNHHNFHPNNNIKQINCYHRFIQLVEKFFALKTTSTSLSSSLIIELPLDLITMLTKLVQNNNNNDSVNATFSTGSLMIKNGVGGGGSGSSSSSSRSNQSCATTLPMATVIPRTPPPLPNYYQNKIFQFSIGSLINLAKFLPRFNIFYNGSGGDKSVKSNKNFFPTATTSPTVGFQTKHLIHLEIRMIKKCLVLYYHLSSSSTTTASSSSKFYRRTPERVYKLMYSFASIKQIVFDQYQPLMMKSTITKNATNNNDGSRYRVYFDLHHTPLLYYADLDDTDCCYSVRRKFSSELINPSELERKLKWNRTTSFYGDDGDSDNGRGGDTSILGMCKSFCIECKQTSSPPLSQSSPSSSNNNNGGKSSQTISTTTTTSTNNNKRVNNRKTKISSSSSSLSATTMLEQLLLIAYICKSVSKNFAFHLASIEMIATSGGDYIDSKSSSLMKMPTKTLKPSTSPSSSLPPPLSYATILRQHLSCRSLPFSIYYATQVILCTSYCVLDSLYIDGTMKHFFDKIEQTVKCILYTTGNGITNIINDHHHNNTDDDYNNNKTLNAQQKSLFFAMEQCLYQLKYRLDDMLIVDVYQELCQVLSTLPLPSSISSTLKSPSLMIAANNTTTNGISGSSTGGNHYIMIRRANLSPTHLQLLPPIPLLHSRFSQLANIDYALRLTLIEDNNRKLNRGNSGGGGKYQNYHIRDRCSGGDPINDSHQFIKTIFMSHLLKGIKIGNRLYEFLGSSSSQMRENGVIMYARDNTNRTASDIRELAGDLSKFLNNVAKYVARFGLMFSQAISIVNIDEQFIRITKDVKGEMKEPFENRPNRDGVRYCFSDGVGVISQTLVINRILPQLSDAYLNGGGNGRGGCGSEGSGKNVSKSRSTNNSNSKQYIPSAYQIRCGGCKGVLVTYETRTPAIVFRDSMRKYDSTDCSLGILKYSMPRPVYLNRPLINILDQLGVARDVFYRHFDQSTTLVAKALLYDSCALELLKTYSISFLPYERLYHLSTTTTNVTLLREPFLRCLVNYLINYRLNELKCKARIRIPFNCGRMAFGVIDESNQLEYGQVFFQYTKMLNSVDDDNDSDDENDDGSVATKVLEGDIMVTKFPCLQPGDVRKLRAVKVDSLMHIKDCIVFPKKGPRPHPDEMGGSDLDGDEYAVFWDPSLLFPGQNHESMTFPYDLDEKSLHNIELKDIVEFYCDFLLQNNIGQVANSHLIYSDYHPEGLFSAECHELAKNYAISLDYQKTGFIKPLNGQYQLPIRPDFMERFTTDKVYLSSKILGQYYRHCSLIETIIALSQLDETKLSSSSSSQHFNDPHNLMLPQWRRYYPQAEEAFLDYRLRVTEILHHLDLNSEVVLFSDVYENKSDVAKILVDNFFAYFRQKFSQQLHHITSSSSALQDNDDDDDHHITSPSPRLLLISAWYAICHAKPFTYGGKQLLGLPWIVANELCTLAQFVFQQQQQHNHHNQQQQHKQFCPTRTNKKQTYVDYHYYDSQSLPPPPPPPPPSITSILTHIDAHTTVKQHYWDVNDILPSNWWSTLFTSSPSPSNMTTMMATIATRIHWLVMNRFQVKLTTMLACHWLHRIKRDIYHDICSDEDDEDEDGEEDKKMAKNSKELLAIKTVFINADDDEVEPIGIDDHHQRAEHVRFITEEQMLEEFVQNQLVQINKECCENAAQQQQQLRKQYKESTSNIYANTSISKEYDYRSSLPTITTLFNRLLMSLFDMCNCANASIYHGKIEKIFLLKYGVFALTFLDRLLPQVDKKFYHQISKRLCWNFSFVCSLYETMVDVDEIGGGGGSGFRNVRDIHDQTVNSEIDSIVDKLLDKLLSNHDDDDDDNGGVGSVADTNALPDTTTTTTKHTTLTTTTTNTSTIYHHELDMYFNKYLRDSNYLQYQTVIFNLLPSNLKIDLQKVGAPWRMFFDDNNNNNGRGRFFRKRQLNGNKKVKSMLFEKKMQFSSATTVNANASATAAASTIATTEQCATFRKLDKLCNNNNNISDEQQSTQQQQQQQQPKHIFTTSSSSSSSSSISSSTTSLNSSLDRLSTLPLTNSSSSSPSTSTLLFIIDHDDKRHLSTPTKVEESFVQKLFFLTGLENMEFIYTNTGNDDNKDNDDHSHNDDDNIINYDVDDHDKYWKSSLNHHEHSGGAGDDSGGDGNGGNKRREQCRQQQQQLSTTTTTTPTITSAMLSKQSQYQVKTTGLLHSIMILRLLFGHPNFFQNISTKFSIVSDATTAADDDNDDDYR